MDIINALNGEAPQQAKEAGIPSAPEANMSTFQTEPEHAPAKPQSETGQKTKRK
jgi:hypothetical protein